jgi:hypothetical protein
MIHKDKEIKKEQDKTIQNHHQIILTVYMHKKLIQMTKTRKFSNY